MIDYSFEPRVTTATQDNLARMNLLNDCFGRFIKKCLLLDNMEGITDVCNQQPELDEERRVTRCLRDNPDIYISNKEMPFGYQTGHLSIDDLKNMNALRRIRIALGVLRILSGLEKDGIYPGALNLNSVVFDRSFKYSNVYLGSVTKYQVGCLRQLFPVQGYNSDEGLPLFFDSKMQHTANVRLALSILTPSGDDLKGLVRNDPLVTYLGQSGDCSPSELIRVILSHIDVSWLNGELTDDEYDDLFDYIEDNYPDIRQVTPEEAAGYMDNSAFSQNDTPYDAGLPVYKFNSDLSEPMTVSVPLDSGLQNDPEQTLSSTMSKLRKYVISSQPQISSEKNDDDSSTQAADAVPEKRPQDSSPGLVPGKIGMCFIIPPFTQTTETLKFREQISLVQSSAAVALGNKTKELETAFFWANSPEDVHSLYAKSSHTGFMPFDISYSPPILPGTSKDPSFIKQAYVSSETLSSQNGLRRTLNVVLLPFDTSDASWVVEHAKKQADDRNRVLFIHADESWATGINTDDPEKLSELTDEIRNAFTK